MKKILIFCLCLSSVLLSFAQHGNIGIGTANPDSSSKLDIQSIDKGLLIPRIALVSVDSTAPISAPALSLLIFNTTTNLELSPGFYFWDGNLWQKLSTANSTLGLDEAYDGNGAGAGRIIEADQG
ncbi:MAG: hypothetical protein KDC82_08410, partial [Bacteroidetes bacterium]|nr:hypothetical protein [Bacteroidota bacterium]